MHGRRRPSPAAIYWRHFFGAFVVRRSPASGRRGPESRSASVYMRQRCTRAFLLCSFASPVRRAQSSVRSIGPRVICQSGASISRRGFLFGCPQPRATRADSRLLALRGRMMDGRRAALAFSTGIVCNNKLARFPGAPAASDARRAINFISLFYRVFPVTCRDRSAVSCSLCLVSLAAGIH